MTIEELQQLKEEEIRLKFEEVMGQPALSSEGTFNVFKAGYLANEQPTGNQHIGYLKEGNKTLEKVRPDEPIFILRAQDNTAPEIVQYWIARNLDTVDEAKLKEAFQVVLAMRRYTSRRDPT